MGQEGKAETGQEEPGCLGPWPHPWCDVEPKMRDYRGSTSELRLLSLEGSVQGTAGAEAGLAPGNTAVLGRGLPLRATAGTTAAAVTSPAVARPTSGHLPGLRAARWGGQSCSRPGGTGLTGRRLAQAAWLVRAGVALVPWCLGPPSAHRPLHPHSGPPAESQPPGLHLQGWAAPKSELCPCVLEVMRPKPCTRGR